jgi:hypothetical protein
MTDSKKKSGNISEQEFRDLSLSWGTSITGNICQRALSGIYEVLGILSKHPSFGLCVQKGYFLSGIQIKKLLEPTRVIVVGKGKNRHTEKKGDINVLRLDGIRFLLPKERAVLRGDDASQQVDSLIKNFDSSEISTRDYGKLENKLKSVISTFTTYYYQIRRNARDRLYVIKDIRREMGQPDQINDSEFNRDDLLDTTESLAKSAIVDQQRLSEVTTLLRTNVLIPTLPFGQI